jgi:hypothetical protein
MVAGFKSERWPVSRRKTRPASIGNCIQAFLARPIEGEWLYLWLDATYVKVRRDHRIVSIASSSRSG